MMVQLILIVNVNILDASRGIFNRSAVEESEMAPKGKARSIFIKLFSSAGSGFFYTTSKNPRKTTQKLQLMKYDPVVRQHVLFVESKK